MSSEAAPQDGVTVNYSAERVIGNGSFGVVFQATVAQTGEVVAIKKVLQDKRFKNRELQIMRKLNHPNIVLLRHCFYSNGEKSDELYLNLVLEYVPETISKVSRHYHKNHKTMPQVLVKLYTFQICRALAYIHALGICHRDIKVRFYVNLAEKIHRMGTNKQIDQPQNILVDPATHVVKLCDFGSAKVLVVGEPNVSYICSRYYRSPELIFGSTDYSTAIDIWSLGCVCAELMLAHPMFPGENGVAQLVEIIKVLGTPTRGEIESMNQNYSDFKFPQIKPHPWEKVFKNVPPNSKLLDLVPRMLSYSPASRITPIEALTHDAFDELFRKDLVLPNGRKVPELLNFTPVELKSGGDLLAKFR